MSDDNEVQPPSGRGGPGVPEAVVEAKSRISIVWLIPILAVLIGAFLSYRAIMERGPTITIRFETGEGLQAGKTTVRYKDIEVGQVTDVVLEKGLVGVIVTAQLNTGAEDYLTDETRFWVVRATVSAGQVSGIGTIFSGAYIGMEPSTEGKRTRTFTGLEVAPVVTRDQPGAHFTLRSENLGSFNLGAPIYYRKIRVGQVVAYELDETGEFVTVEVFVRAPHDKRVFQNTRFWDASGFDVSLGAEGVKIDSPSIVSMLFGGVAFDTSPGVQASDPPEADHVFELYPNRQASLEKKYTEFAYFLSYFDGSVQGLVPGSPVMFRGIRIGEVVDLNIEYSPEKVEFSIPVLMKLEPQRIDVTAADLEEERPIFALVARGLRAQLTSGSLLTGQLQVELDIHPNVPPATVDMSGRYPAIPTIPRSIEELTTGIAAIVDKLEELPIEEIGQEVVKSLKALNSTLESTDALLDPDGPTRRELTRAIAEMAQAARSARLLAEYLEQHPEALVRGKEQ
ncbi:MAG: MCE family protein [Deltaproteobacteria bacterium]|nr:MCE family protein [Deltaproteobacteria bacterium]